MGRQYVRPYLFAFAVLLAGCGGETASSLLDGSSGSVSLAFSSASSYNGSSTALSSYSALSGSAAGNTMTINVINGSRTFTTFLLADSLAQGVSVDLSTTTGSVVSYSDSAGDWTATSGTVTVTSRDSTGVTLTLTNVVLTNSGNNATGTVTVNGTVSFVSG